MRQTWDMSSQATETQLRGRFYWENEEIPGRCLWREIKVRPFAFLVGCGRTFFGSWEP
jgi:hypothetical protein